MNKKILSRLIFGASLLLLAACTKDETTDPNTLPEGQYPLQIASVTMSVESSERPWSANAPQTRVTESDTDGKSSVWEWNGTEKIGVQIGDGKTGTYVLEDKTITAENACYWASTATGQTVKAWFPTTDKLISLDDQNKGLAYVLQATKTVDFDEPVILGFTHQLAKVRVLLDGTQAAQAKNVEVMGYTSCTHTQGTVTAGDTEDWLKMKHTTYNNGTECWEANVVPGRITLNNFIQLNGTNVVTNLSGIPETLEGGRMYTVDLTVGDPIAEITAENNSPINNDGYYRVKDTFNQQINITGGKPTIYLENANISVDGNAINITSGNPTIHVQGTSSISSSKGAGIYVAEGNTVTITGSSRDDKLTVKGGEGSSGIGGNITGVTTAAHCGNIKITEVWIDAYGSYDINGNGAPGIGGAGNASCGTITINNATVFAYGSNMDNISSSAIGCGICMTGEKGSFKTITIQNGSKVSVQRGNHYSAYIGYSGFKNAPSTEVIIATVDETSTVIKLN